MPHIFISYASEDRAIAQKLAGALEQEGWTVWWDRKIPVGKSFHEVIEDAIDAARCVIVIWTDNSVESDWVRNEADEGNRRSILVPVRMGEVRIPLGFRHLQAADLQSWNPGATHAEYDSLLESIRAVFGQPAPTPKPKPQPQPFIDPRPVPPGPDDGRKEEKRRSRKMEWIAAGVAVAVIGAAIVTALEEGSFEEAVQPPLNVGNLGQSGQDVFAQLEQSKSVDTKGAAPHFSVQWQDHAVRFDGKLTYAGGTQGQIRATLHDLGTGATLGEQTFPVQLQAPANNQYLISGEVVIPNGDSTTAGRHTHSVFIQVQEQMDGNVMAQNCTMQGCYPATVAPDGDY